MLPTVYKLCSRKVSPHCSVNSVPKSSASLATMAETTGWPSCCETAQLATFPGDPCKYHQLLPATVTLVNYHSHPDLTAGQAPQSLRYQGLGDTRRQPSKQTSPDKRLIISPFPDFWTVIMIKSIFLAFVVTALSGARVSSFTRNELAELPLGW